MSIEIECENTCLDDVYDEGLDFWTYYYIDMFDGERIAFTVNYVILNSLHLFKKDGTTLGGGLQLGDMIGDLMN